MEENANASIRHFYNLLQVENDTYVYGFNKSKQIKILPDQIVFDKAIIKTDQGCIHQYFCLADGNSFPVNCTINPKLFYGFFKKRSKRNLVILLFGNKTNGLTIDYYLYRPDSIKQVLQMYMN